MKIKQMQIRPESERTRHHSEDTPVDPEPVAVAPDAKARKKALDEGFDAVLEEIDGVLEANAEEFVNGFVQKGGE